MKLFLAAIAEFILFYKTPLKWFSFATVLVWTAWSSYAKPVLEVIDRLGEL